MPAPVRSAVDAVSLVKPSGNVREGDSHSRFLEQTAAAARNDL